jgi:heme exporter protein B
VSEFLRQAWTIAAKDLRSEIRNKEAMNAAVAFSVVVLLLFSLAFEPAENPDIRELAGGLLWLVYLFAGILILNRSFARESANSLPVFGMFYDVHWMPHFGLLLLVFFLGTWAFTSVGTIFSAITANHRMRELMLPLLVFPLTVPALMACVKLTMVILTGEPLGDSIVWFKLLIGFDVIFTLLGAVLLESVLVN